MSYSSYQKKMIFRAQHRGTKEMDFLIGRFVEAQITSFDEKQLADLETFLNMADADIYDLIYGHVVPEEKSNSEGITPFIEMMQDYYKISAEKK